MLGFYMNLLLRSLCHMQDMQCQQGCDSHQTQVPQTCTVFMLHGALTHHNFVLCIRFGIALAAYVLKRQPNSKLEEQKHHPERG